MDMTGPHSIRRFDLTLRSVDIGWCGIHRWGERVEPRRSGYSEWPMFEGFYSSAVDGMMDEDTRGHERFYVISHMSRFTTRTDIEDTVTQWGSICHRHTT